MMNRFKMVILLLELFIKLIHFDIELRLFGFQKVFPKYITRYKGKDNLDIDLSSEYITYNVNPIIAAIDLACSLYPFEAQCLHRSFLGYRLIRSKLKIPVELVVGARKFPFSAHAWLVYKGININEEEDYIKQFNTLLNSESW